MNRRALVNSCFQYGQQLTLTDADYQGCVNDLLHWMAAYDDVEDDWTTTTLNLYQPITAVIQAKQGGIVCGIEEVLFYLGKYSEIAVQHHVKDGSAVEKGTLLLTLRLPMNRLLSLERIMLNVIGRMSGIATQTQRLVALAKTIPDCPAIAATRKTPWMLLDKKAVYCGGGLTHRLQLSHAILIKDNHLFALGQQLGKPSAEAIVQKAVELAVTVKSLGCVEIEVESVEQARAALNSYRTAVEKNPDAPTMIVLLDNFTPSEVTRFIGEVRTDPLYNRV